MLQLPVPVLCPLFAPILFTSSQFIFSAANRVLEKTKPPDGRSMAKPVPPSAHLSSKRPKIETGAIFLLRGSYRSVVPRVTPALPISEVFVFPDLDDINWCYLPETSEFAEVLRTWRACHLPRAEGPRAPRRDVGCLLAGYP